MLKPEISIVIPCLNEEKNIKNLYTSIIKNLDGKLKYEIVFVDDGSTDKTLKTIKALERKFKNVSYISFSRNFGHQIALKAGLDVSKGRCVITMDADMQHPPQMLPKLIGKWREGYDIVFTVRKSDQYGLLKKVTSKFFYNILNTITDHKIEYGAADFRLLDEKVVNIIKQMPENDLFLRGTIPWVGFRQYRLEYQPNERFAGSSKYSFPKMFELALNGITSFSVKPLRLSTYFGYFVAMFSFFYGIYAITTSIFTSRNISGWTSLLVIITFLGGVQMIVLGILGEYLGKLFINEKKRPNYIIREISKRLK